MRSRRWLPWLLVACACSPGISHDTSTTTEVGRPTTTLELTSSSTAHLTPPPGADVVIATTVDEFGDVADALADATEQWESAVPAAYAYRVRIECECADRGTTWVRVFDPAYSDDVPLDVELLHGRIGAALEQSPTRIEVAFEPELGIPVWFSVDGTHPEALIVEEFHEIDFAATPHDGVWRFTGGEVEGEEFGNPTTGLIIATIRDGSMSFPVDCNMAFGPIDIHGSSFGIGSMGTTLAGCGEISRESNLFMQAVQSAKTIERAGPDLVLSGENGVVRLVPLESPERRGELPLTAAGETLVVGDDPGAQASAFTISAGGAESINHPGQYVLYELTAVEPDSDLDPTWSRWVGEFDVPPAPSGPQEIVMPADIGVGDYQLCSPYWVENFFCYDLLVRPASAPWYVTAGADGVVLHDADGTSQTVWEEATRLAFWFDELMLIESETGTITIIRDSAPAFEVAGEGSVLLDAGRMGESVVALIVRRGETLLVDTNRDVETNLGPAATEGRIGGALVVLRPSTDMVEARSSADGSVVWSLDVDPQEMISSVTERELRLDSGGLTTEGSPVPYWQFLETRIVDGITGEVVDEFSFELAIPLEGDQVTETCLRAELRDGVMLCPQPDGRLTTIGVEGADQLTVAGVSDVIATFVR